MGACGHPNLVITRAGKVSAPEYDEPRLAQRSRSCWGKTANALRGELTSAEDLPTSFLHVADHRIPTEFCAKVTKPLHKAVTESQKDKERC